MINLRPKEKQFSLHKWLYPHIAFLLLTVAALTGAGTHQAYAQQVAVTGTVTDTEGAPLPGATVVVKGTTNGVTTGGDGTVSLNVPDRNGVLVVSFLGFTTKEVPVNGQSKVNIALGADAKALEEVVIIGYGTQRRSDVTGALSSVSSKEIKDQPVARVDQALQGKAAGVVIQNNNAAPNGQVMIRVRGSNSIQGTNDPLVVIDGFIGGDLSSVNPNDVSNIEVLKDASSTAIYGSRGSNGVILVTTKRGAAGKTTVQFNNYVSFNSVRKKLDLLDAGQYAEAVNANRTELGLTAPFSASEVAGFKANGGTDWQDEIFKDALQQNHQVSLSGGSQNTSYYLSGSYINNDGIIKNTSFRQYSLRSNIDTRINSKFKAGVNLYLSRSLDNPTALNGYANGSPVFNASLWAPTLPVYNEDGSYTQPTSSYGPRTIYNPLATVLEPVNDNIRERTEVNPYLEYTIAEGLTARFSGGARLINDENSYYLNTRPQGNVGNASAGITNSKTVVYLIPTS